MALVTFDGSIIVVVAAAIIAVRWGQVVDDVAVLLLSFSGFVTLFQFMIS